MTKLKASVSLLSNINRTIFTTIAPLLTGSRNYVFSQSPTLPSSPLHSTTGRCLQFSPETHGVFLKPHPFQTNASRNLRIPLKKPTPLEAFESATTAEEMVSVFKEMEACLDGKELGLASLKVGLKLQEEGKDPEKALPFAEKALKALDHDGEEPSLVVALVLHLMGFVHFRLKRFDDSLGYLNRADRMLCRVEEEGIASVEDIRPRLYYVQLSLGNVKRAMERGDEAIGNLKKALEIQEMTLETGGKELEVAYRDLADTCFWVSKLQEALRFGLKALEIHKEELGHNSVEVAYDRRILGNIYSVTEEHEKALEQFELSWKVFKHCGLSSELLPLEMDAANVQIALGKYDEAISTLKGILKQTKNEKDSENQASMFILIGKALCKQGNFADSKGCLEIACRIIDKKEAVSPYFVAQSYADIAMGYVAMDETETAISLLKRTLTLMEKQPHEQQAQGTTSARIGWIHLLRGEVPKAVPYLENAVEKLKEISFASKHYVAGYNYNNLGAAYLELKRHQSAADMFVVAKDILDAYFGPHHPDSIRACQNLSKAYSAMGSYTLAMEFQQQVIDAWESHGPIARGEIREARRILEELKRKARGTSSFQLPTKALLLPRNSSQSSY